MFAGSLVADAFDDDDAVTVGAAVAVNLGEKSDRGLQVIGGDSEGVSVLFGASAGEPFLVHTSEGALTADQFRPINV